MVEMCFFTDFEILSGTKSSVWDKRIQNLPNHDEIA